MRICIQKRESGSVLMVVLVTMLLIGVTLASYLHLVSNQNLSVMRSQAWNSAIAVAEAGLEEAMAHLNKNTTNRALDGWLLSGTNVVKERTLGDNKYKVFISALAEPPVIVAEAYVRVPQSEKFIEPPRRVRVTTTNDALFAKGMVAKGRIDLAGNKIRTDSFDSSDPAFSTGGAFDPAKIKDGGDVATNSSLTDSLDAWNADIFGKASTGPGGKPKLGPNGAIGSKAWHDAGKKGIEPGWSTDDMNVHFPDVTRPWAGVAFPPVPGTILTTNYKYLLGTGNYQLESLILTGGEKLLVEGHAILLVTKEIRISGGGAIQITKDGSLNLYMEGPTTTITGNGLLNGTGDASKFSYWGMNSNTEVTMTGNAGYTGTIYAPHAAVTLGGGGNNVTQDFIGAVVGNSIRMNGHFSFHYDEALRKFGPRRGYTITSWNEL